MKRWMLRARRAALLSLALPLAAHATEEKPLPAPFDADRHMRVSEVRPGMKGYGLSVFQGTKIERFDVEVVSILKDFNPGTDVVLIRCHGANLEHTGSIAGMSGSPIFLRDADGHDRLIGAFAYGWPLAKDPLAGVQPIEYMLAAPPAQPPVAAEAKLDEAKPESPNPTSKSEQKIRWSIQDVKLPQLSGAAATPLQSPIDALHPSPRLGIDAVDAMHLQPLATPLTTAGVPAKVREQLGPLFSAYGLSMLEGGSAGAYPDAAPPKMEPGAVLAVPMLVGDADMTALGTCTEVLGDRVFGFGHPFQNEGSVLLPMGGGMVHTVVANLSSSFKIGSMTTRVGRLVSDRAVGISGAVGEFPPLVPIDLHVVYADGSFDRTYHFETVAHPRFTPMLSAVALSSAINGANDLPQYHTLDYDLKLEFANGQEIAINNRAVNVSPQDLFMTIATPIVSAADNPFGRVMMKKVTGTVHVTPTAMEGRILDINVPRSKYRPGETLSAFVRYKPFRGAENILPVQLELPATLPDGAYQLVISDWQRYSVDEMGSKPFRFTAESVDEMFDVLRDYTGVKRNAIYLRLVQRPDGVAIGRTALPQLPSSRRQIFVGAGRSNTSQYISSTTKVVPTDLVMSGAAEFVVTIDADRAVALGAGPDGSTTRPPAESKPANPPARLPNAPAQPPAPPAPAPGGPATRPSAR